MSQLVAVSSPASGRELKERYRAARAALFPCAPVQRPRLPPVQSEPAPKRQRVDHLYVADIVNVVAEHFNVNPQCLILHDRRRKLNRPRQVAMFLAMELTGHSFAQVARLLDRDAATIRHGEAAIAGDIEDGRPIAADVESIRARLLA